MVKLRRNEGQLVAEMIADLAASCSCCRTKLDAPGDGRMSPIENEQAHDQPPVHSLVAGEVLEII